MTAASCFNHLKYRVNRVVLPAFFGNKTVITTFCSDRLCFYELRYDNHYYSSLEPERALQRFRLSSRYLWWLFLKLVADRLSCSRRLVLCHQLEIKSERWTLELEILLFSFFPCLAPAALQCTTNGPLESCLCIALNADLGAHPTVYDVMRRSSSREKLSLLEFTV